MGNSPEKIKAADLERKTLKTNQIWKKLNRLAMQIKLKVQNHIKYNNIK